MQRHLFVAAAKMAVVSSVIAWWILVQQLLT